MLEHMELKYSLSLYFKTRWEWCLRLVVLEVRSKILLLFFTYELTMKIYILSSSYEHEKSIAVILLGAS